MKKINDGWVKFLVTVGIVCSLTACAPPQQDARKRFFWPPGDAEPKIEYINFYHAEEDVRRDVDSSLEDAILGKTRPTLVFQRPSAIASDGAGRVYVADQALNRVFVWDFEQNQLGYLRNSGNGIFGFSLVAGVAIGDEGQVFVSDSLRKVIHVFDSGGRYLKSLVSKKIQRPTGLSFDRLNKRLYVVDTEVHQVHMLDEQGAVITSLGKRGVSPGDFNYPLDADVDVDGNLYVLDAMNARVQVFDSNGDFLRQFGERGTESGSFQIPKSIAVSPSGLVFVTDSQAHKFVVFNTQGEFLISIGGRNPAVTGAVSPGGFYLPEGISVDRTDAIWVVDSLNRMFHKFQYLNGEYLKEHPILPGQAYPFEQEKKDKQ